MCGTNDAAVFFDAVFEELHKVQTAEDFRRLGLSSYGVRGFLDLLRGRAEISREQLARLEYRALPLLRWTNSENLAIHELMAEDPAFFVQVICDVFLPAHRDKAQDTKPTLEAEARAQAGYTSRTW